MTALRAAQAMFANTPPPQPPTTGVFFADLGCFATVWNTHYRATANAYARSCYRRLSVCLSVGLSNARIVTKRNNSLSIFQHLTTQRSF